MVNFDDWMDEGNSPEGENRYASDQWRLIQINPKSIAFKRGSTTLTAQTVSIQPGNEERQVELASGKSMTIRDIVIFGVSGHPTVGDTDIRKDDQFAYLGRLYKVTDVIVNEGSLQAWAEAIA
jgi:hypothetical protein